MKTKKSNQNEISRILHNIRRGIMASIPLPPLGEMHRKMTMPQIHVMTFLDEKESLTMRDLARSSGVAMPSMTDMINRLVRQDLVERSRDEQDRRIIHVKLSTKGKKIIRQFHNVAGDKLDILFAQLSVQEKKKVTEGLQIMERMISDEKIIALLQKTTKKRGKRT